jgi:hypothetical protein
MHRLDFTELLGPLSNGQQMPWLHRNVGRFAGLLEIQYLNKFQKSKIPLAGLERVKGIEPSS